MGPGAHAVLNAEARHPHPGGPALPQLFVVLTQVVLGLHGQHTIG